MDKRLMHYEFPRDQIQLDGTTVELRTKIAAVVADTTDAAIVEAIIEAARAEDITDLHLLDKTFILDAIREKLEREKQGKVAPEKPPTDLRGKCGGCAYAVTVPACGSTFAYVQCTNPEHLSRYSKRHKSGIRQRTTKACKKYLQREGL